MASYLSVRKIKPYKPTPTVRMPAVDLEKLRDVCREQPPETRRET